MMEVGSIEKNVNGASDRVRWQQAAVQHELCGCSLCKISMLERTTGRELELYLQTNQGLHRMWHHLHEVSAPQIPD